MRRLLITAVAAAAIAGCGSGSDEPGYAARADAICADANKQEAALGAEGPGWMYTDQFDDPEFLARFTAVGSRALRELRALEPPASRRDEAERVLASVGHMVKALQARIADLRADRDERRGEQVRAYQSGYGALAAAAGPLGLSECQGLLV